MKSVDRLASSTVTVEPEAADSRPEKLSGYAPEEGVSVAAIVPCEDGSLWVLERVSGGMEGMTLDDLIRHGLHPQLFRQLCHIDPVQFLLPGGVQLPPDLACPADSAARSHETAPQIVQSHHLQGAGDGGAAGLPVRRRRGGGRG